MSAPDPHDVLRRLAKPFPAAAVSWRVGTVARDKRTALALCYIDARDVQARLDEVCGPFWQCKHGELRAGALRVAEPESEEGDDKKKRARRSGSIVTCSIGILFGDMWIWRSDGAGDTAVEAEKGSMSDALKRAAVQWGVGRYLYAIESPRVKLNDWRQIEKEEEPRLRAILERGIAAWERGERLAHEHHADTSRALPAPPPAPPPARSAAPAAPRQPEPTRREEEPPVPDAGDPDALCAGIVGAKSLDEAVSRLVEAKRAWPSVAGPFEESFVERVKQALDVHPAKREQIAARIAKLNPPVEGMPRRKLERMLTPSRAA